MDYKWTYAYGASEEIVHKNKDIKCNNMTKQYTKSD